MNEQTFKAYCNLKQSKIESFTFCYQQIFYMNQNFWEEYSRHRDHSSVLTEELPVIGGVEGVGAGVGVEEGTLGGYGGVEPEL